MDKHGYIDTEQVNFGYSDSIYTTPDYDLHCHNFYEVYFFLEGDVDYLVEGRQYKPTPCSLLLLSPHVFHGVRINSSTPYRRYSIHFHPDILSADRRDILLSAFPSSGQEASRIYFERVDRFRIPCCFEDLEDCAGQEKSIRDRLLPVYTENLLARIMSMSAALGTVPGLCREPATIEEIILYLNLHLKEPITLDQLSDRFFISKHHLNKVFRKATGTTVFHYLLHKRVILAQQLLIEGNSAQEAAIQAGFGDYSSFYRAYTHILGHSPLKDRGVLPPLSVSSGKGLKNVGLRKQPLSPNAD